MYFHKGNHIIDFQLSLLKLYMKANISLFDGNLYVDFKPYWCFDHFMKI